MITARHENSQNVQTSAQQQSSADDIHFPLREALFAYSTQREENKDSASVNFDEILNAKEIRACNMATD